MFKYSQKFLEKLAQQNIDIEKFNRNWLDMQGFEVASLDKLENDTIVELEVKANRPDMLSHLGVLREFYVSQKKNINENIKDNINVENLLDLNFDINNLPNVTKQVEVKSNSVKHLIMLEMHDIDNTKDTPQEFKELLKNLGVASISPLVDISNFVMLAIGQPIHIYDLDCVKDKIVFKNNETACKFKTLKGDEINIQENYLTINDANDMLCLAGIIGGQKAEITANTKNIIIECATFDTIPIRIASQNTHVSTLSSMRNERGVDSKMNLIGAKYVAKLVKEMCGGKVVGFSETGKLTPTNTQNLSVKRTNDLLGTNLTGEEIATILNNYYFSCKVIDANNIEVTCPSYRVDLESEIDIIGDIAMMYGYHNVTPTPDTLIVDYVPNKNYDIASRVRELLIGAGINECMSYSFIKDDSNSMLNLSSDSKLNSEIKILNPLSNNFALMRGNMVYSMLDTLIFNYSKNGYCEPIFDLGKIYKKDKNADTGYSQTETIGVILTGEKLSKGFGIDKAQYYDFYDIKQVLELLCSQMNIEFSLTPNNDLCFKKHYSANIIINGKECGVLGVINEKTLNNFENGKLCKNDVCYLELQLDNLSITKKEYTPVSKFQNVVREYNLLVPNHMEYANYAKIIRETSPKITNLSIIDIYKGKGVPEGFTSVLISVEYSDLNKTLESEEVEAVEKEFLLHLSLTFNIVLKA